MDPTPENLAQLRSERIARARTMDPELKIMAGPRLFALAVEAMRAGIRLQNPNATDAEIMAIVRDLTPRAAAPDPKTRAGQPAATRAGKPAQKKYRQR